MGIEPILSGLEGRGAATTPRPRVAGLASGRPSLPACGPPRALSTGFRRAVPAFMYRHHVAAGGPACAGIGLTASPMAVGESLLHCPEPHPAVRPGKGLWVPVPPGCLNPSSVGSVARGVPADPAVGIRPEARGWPCARPRIAQPPAGKQAWRSPEINSTTRDFACSEFRISRIPAAGRHAVSTIPSGPCRTRRTSPESEPDGGHPLPIRWHGRPAAPNSPDDWTGPGSPATGWRGHWASSLLPSHPGGPGRRRRRPMPSRGWTSTTSWWRCGSGLRRSQSGLAGTRSVFGQTDGIAASSMPDPRRNDTRLDVRDTPMALDPRDTSAYNHFVAWWENPWLTRHRKVVEVAGSPVK